MSFLIGKRSRDVMLHAHSTCRRTKTPEFTLQDNFIACFSGEINNNTFMSVFH